MTCPKCKREIPDDLSCFPHCGAVCDGTNDPSSRLEKTGNGGGWLSGLIGFGVLAAMTVVWFLFRDVKIGYKPLLFWVAVAGFLISRNFGKEKK